MTDARKEMLELADEIENTPAYLCMGARARTLAATALRSSASAALPDREAMVRIVESKICQIPTEGTWAFRQRKIKELAMEGVDAILALLSAARGGE